MLRERRSNDYGNLDQSFILNYWKNNTLTSPSPTIYKNISLSLNLNPNALQLVLAVWWRETINCAVILCSGTEICSHSRRESVSMDWDWCLKNSDDGMMIFVNEMLQIFEQYRMELPLSKSLMMINTIGTLRERFRNVGRWSTWRERETDKWQVVPWELNSLYAHFFLVIIIRTLEPHKHNTY